MARWWWLLPASCLLLADRLTKAWVLHTLPVGQPQPLIGNVIRLTRIHNKGAAFGLFPESGAVFLVVSSLIAAVLVFLLVSERIRPLLLRWGLLVVLAGALGNLIDRVAYGYVLDFFELRGFPVFNVADACITVGAGLVILHILFGGDRHESAPHADHA